MLKGHVTEEVAAALSKCFAGGIGPTHRELGEVFRKSKVDDLDPAQFSDESLSKEVRVRIVVGHLAQDRMRREAGERLTDDLLARMRVSGSFDPGGENYAGAAALRVLSSAFETAGWNLDSRGRLSPLVLANVEHAKLRPALEAQIARLRDASDDAALLLGTAKDFLETVARYVLDEVDQPARPNAEFPELLHLARERLGLLPEQITASDKTGKAVREAFDGLWKIAKAVNELRNIEGTGHGRASLPETPVVTARAVVQAAAVLGQVMLTTLDQTFVAPRRSVNARS